MFIDTHTHIDAAEFDQDREEAILRATEAGAEMLFLPAIDLASSHAILDLCRTHSMLRPMLGLHPEEVKADWRNQLAQLRDLINSQFTIHNSQLSPSNSPKQANCALCIENCALPIAIGEIGLDFYWSREFEKEQMEAFEEQVRWAIELDLPLMIHCRKAQNELTGILKRYKNQLKRGGVFHCFTGNVIEARQLLEFDNFALGIGGVLTFKKSNLPETLRETVPLSRIVLETDSPYMAPVPMRGKRNESSYIPYIINKLAEIYGVAPEEVGRITTATALKLFIMSK